VNGRTTALGIEANADVNRRVLVGMQAAGLRLRGNIDATTRKVTWQPRKLRA
jgi:hypothetical protein